VSSDLSQILIQSHKGPYTVDFIANAFAVLAEVSSAENTCLIIDKNVFEIYQKELAPVVGKTPFYVIEATEENKDLAKFTQYAADLVALGAKRNVTLIAVGGGIIQDITCFLASTLFRGMKWIFFPTTLLAQADSCIGSKSSINVGGIKNLMGTFTPPNQIYISLNFLKTLKPEDILSGIGEMIKVHGIGGIKMLKSFAQDYDQLMKDDETFKKYLMSSLLIKKQLIEIDEFDTGPRLVMNYGHTFGHAIESATHFGIPHGIAITLGQSMACEYSFRKNLISDTVRKLAQEVLKKNFGQARQTKINMAHFFQSIQKDKKNVGSKITLIIPVNDEFKIEKFAVEADENFQNFCLSFFKDNEFHVI
jgi:3-dehydroquinate synthase